MSKEAFINEKGFYVPLRRGFILQFYQSWMFVAFKDIGMGRGGR